MLIEFTALTWGALLGAIHIFLAVRQKIRQYGPNWSMGPRDEIVPPPTPVLGRLMRAQSNYFETFPIVAAGVLMLGLTGLNTRWTAIASLVWLTARIVYLPLYVAGVRNIRTFSFMISVVAIITLFWPLLAAGINTSLLAR